MRNSNAALMLADPVPEDYTAISDFRVSVASASFLSWVEEQLLERLSDPWYAYLDLGLGRVAILHEGSKVPFLIRGCDSPVWGVHVRNCDRAERRRIIDNAPLSVRALTVSSAGYSEVQVRYYPYSKYYRCAFQSRKIPLPPDSIFDDLLSAVKEIWDVGKHRSVEPEGGQDDREHLVSVNLPDDLPGRDREIVRGVLAGDSNAIIADRLCLSPKTIANRLSMIRAQSPDGEPRRR